MTSFLISASITLVILLSILSHSTADLVDIDGDPILNGGHYYIIPITTTTSTSGLTYTEKEDQCPLYITKETTENSPGTPVKISSEARTLHISLDEPVSLTFQAFASCLNLLAWDITFDPLGRKVYITAGGDQSSMDKYPFSIIKKDNSLASTYELKYGTGTNVVLYEDDGLLGLIFTANSTMVSFKKTEYFLEFPTTSKIQ
ncbi:hypothetical protein RND81_01G141000 [Saponaria officinalis]|uniref:Uncharacterized protein n=1 Tax=Saponaria officinalis TaxID=3572 RepID=A0AAW1N9Y8_SAPOF